MALLTLQVGQVIECRQRAALREHIRKRAAQAGLHRACQLDAQLEGQLLAAACICCAALSQILPGGVL